MSNKHDARTKSESESLPPVMTTDEVVRLATEAATPIDIEELISQGFLRRRPRSKHTYEVLRKLPAPVSRRVSRFAMTTARDGTKVTTITLRPDSHKAGERLLGRFKKR